MPIRNIEKGKIGEDTASSFLEKHGYRIVLKNYRVRIGEVDIIARDKGVICFIEVKMRDSCAFGSPQEAITVYKQRRISKVALCYLKENNLLEKNARFDVVSIVNDQKGAPKIELIQNAFELDE